ncbi:ATP-binding protein [Ammoniphilus resinae]|uniref:histidine kinase n=1 Tax=Ammoniphilus resinae TaxID=861532 RepID=A0ABS4GUD1_9BACL|nr:sensor histidine kinase [Ammoniphilus resinae]MBP1933869.1 sensor histidine kinase regulating citrate/malate metabolism [Ammoniphilus resinae]
MLSNRFLHPSLQLRISVIFIFVIILILLIIGFSFKQIVIKSVEYEVGNNAMEIAHFIALMPAVREGLKSNNPSFTLQPIVEVLQQRTHAKFIVVINNQGIRYTHPNQDLIGKTITGGDEAPALKGEEYISKAVGVSGPSIRAFVPVIDPVLNEQLGVVVVGMFEKNIFTIAKQYVNPLLFWLIIALSFGILASILLARKIKAILHGLEPDEIAKLFQEREAMLESLREGVIAVDRNARITLVNQAARNMLSITENPVGKKITEVIEDSALPRVIMTEESEKDIKIVVNGIPILTNRTPIKVNSVSFGAVATFRDMTDIRELAEELTGVKKYVDGLRAKTHEFMNKLQTLSGLLELQEYEEAKQYIIQTTGKQQKLLQFLNRHVRDPKTSGLLLGKIQQAEELNIKITIDPASHLNPLPKEIPSEMLVLVLGNLLENAMEALNEGGGEINVTFLDKPNEIIVIVEDNGPGIPEELLPGIFQKGFSSKGMDRGYGLHLIMNQVKQVAKGKIDVHSIVGEGSTFVVRLPKHLKKSS